MYDDEDEDDDDDYDYEVGESSSGGAGQDEDEPQTFLDAYISTLTHLLGICVFGVITKLPTAFFFFDCVIYCLHKTHSVYETADKTYSLMRGRWLDMGSWTLSATLWTIFLSIYLSDK